MNNGSLPLQNSAVTYYWDNRKNMIVVINADFPLNLSWLSESFLRKCRSPHISPVEISWQKQVLLNSGDESEQCRHNRIFTRYETEKNWALEALWKEGRASLSLGKFFNVFKFWLCTLLSTAYHAYLLSSVLSQVCVHQSLNPQKTSFLFATRH